MPSKEEVDEAIEGITAVTAGLFANIDRNKIGNLLRDTVHAMALGVREGAIPTGPALQGLAYHITLGILQAQAAMQNAKPPTPEPAEDEDLEELEKPPKRRSKKG